MRCPYCSFHADLMRCPRCHNAFSTDDDEELAHLAYLRRRLDAWHAEGLLPGEAVAHAIASTERDVITLQRKLGLVTADAPPAAPITSAAPPPPAPARAPEPAHPPAPALRVRSEAEIYADLQRAPQSAREAAPPPPDEMRQRAPRPTRPAFSWKQVGIYLLSERTLNALLGLAAFLILASAVVISTLNPTHLQPLAHLGVMAITTLAFFAAGCGVRQKLALTKTGSTLLAISAAFIPLDIWTLGQEQLPRWDAGTVWLVASTLCLPIYLVAHAALRDRTFALLTALAGGSELLAVLHRLHVPLEWSCCAVVALAMGYVLLARRVQEQRAPLAWALFWTAQVATPLVMTGLMAARFFPTLWDIVAARPASGVSVYAVGGAWWLGTAFYALCAHLFPRRHFHIVATWTLPLAYLFTLTKAPWDASWYNLCLALLAAGYLGYGRRALRLPVDDAHSNLGQVLRQPVYQVGLALAAVAGLWPISSLQSQVATLGVLALTYAAVAFLLRDRTFALLTALAGGSELLAVLHRLHVPLEWSCCSLVVLAMGYVLLARRLQERRAPLAWALFWTAQVATPLVMTGLMAARFFPTLWDIVAARPASGVSVYAVGGAWWLGTAFYALCAHLFPRRHFHVVAAWTLPLAYLFTLTKAPWDASWYNLCLALLAAGYLGYGRWALRLPVDDAHSNLGQVLRQPVYQVGLALTLVAGLWPIPSLQSQVATLGVLALTYAAAAFLLRQRACAYVAIALVPMAAALTFQLRALAADVQTLLWAVLAAVLLVAGECAARRTGEAHRALAETALGLGVWRSRFASPLFLVGYAVTLLAMVGLVLVQYPTAPLLAGVPVPGAPVILAALAVVAICGLSTATRRSGFFLYLATWLFLLPVLSLTGLLAHRLGLTPSAAEWMRLPAAVGVGYVALAWALDRFGRRYGQPIYLAGYALLLGAMVFSVPDRAITVQVMGLNLLVYAWSAWLVHRGRHPSYIWVVGCLCGEPTSRAFRTARTLFLYLVAWLFPVWLLLALSLWQWLTPGYEGVGVVLAALAPCYAALALWFGRIAREYRLPWYIGGYALSALGPVVAAHDPAWRAVALAISIALYSASAVVSRRSAWLSLVALLTPVLLGEVLPDLGIGHGFYGLASIGLGLGYDGVSLALQRRGPRRIFHPLGRGVGAYALPFVATSHGLNVLGLALVSTQDRTLALLGFALAALHYVGSAVAFRERLFSYPIVVTTSVAYVVGMTMLPLDQRYIGLALLPGIVTYLIVAEVLRRRLDAPQRAAARSPWDGLTPAAGAIDRRSIRFLLTSWATPFYAVLYAATGAVAAYSSSEPWLWALAWWSIAAVYGVSARLFRHPAWLYPATGAALLAYVATAYAVVPTLSFADAMVTLVPPTWLLFGLAHAVGRRGHATTAPAPRRPWLAGRVWTHPWARPLIVSGVVALVISTAGSAPDAAAGLWTAGASVVLATVLAVLWRSEGAAWASLALMGVTVQEGLRLAGVPMLDQPPRWAALALIGGVLSFIIPSLRRDALRLWRRPLYLGSIGTSVVALAIAMGLAAEIMSQAALVALAATTVVAGLTSIGHAFHRRERLLSYLGVALLEAGYMLQLALFDVGQPQAFTLPAGLYLLAIAYLEWRRGSGARIKALLEVAGLMLVLGTALAQAAGILDAGAGRYVYDVVLLFESLALFALGAVLRWRKIFFASILALVADVFIVLADPIRAMNTWYLLALVGFTMLGVVVFIEQRRQRIPVWVNDWRLRLEAWD